MDPRVKPEDDGSGKAENQSARTIYIYYLGFRCFCLALFAPEMSENIANRLAITHIFTHSWNKNTCVKNTENLSNKCIYNNKVVFILSLSSYSAKAEYCKFKAWFIYSLCCINYVVYYGLY